MVKPLQEKAHLNYKMQRRMLQKEIKKGYYVIIDTVGLTNEHLFELKAALEEMGYSEYILWYY